MRTLATNLGCQVPEQSPGHVGPGPQHGRHHALLYSGLWLLRLEKIQEIWSWDCTASVWKKKVTDWCMLYIQDIITDRLADWTVHVRLAHYIYWLYTPASKLALHNQVF